MTSARQGMDAATYRSIMRHQAGAVTVIAVGPPGERRGLTATAVCSLSDAPPTILACVHRAASAHDVIHRLGSFSVNMLADDQGDLAHRFSGRTGLQGEDRFAGGAWDLLATGAPILKNALASLDCVLTDTHSFTTHSIFLGQVSDGRVRADARPLLYFRGDFWDIGGR